MAGRNNKRKLLKITAVESLDINKSLCGLRQDDRFCDLGFVCANKGKKQPKSKTVFAHKAVLMPLSGLITKLAEISYEKQLGDTMYVSLAEVEFGLAEKLMKCIYEGEISVTNQEKTELVKIASDLDLDVNFESGHKNGTKSRSLSPVESEDPMEYFKLEARERKCQVLLPRLDPSEIDRSDHNDSGSFAKSGNRQRAKVGTKKKSDPILQDDSDDEDEPLKPIKRPSKQVSNTRNTSSSGIECCDVCGKVFIGIDACKRHMEEFHKSEVKDDGDVSSSSDFELGGKHTKSLTKSASSHKKRSNWDGDNDDDETDDDFVKPIKNSKKKPKMSRLMSKLTNWTGGDGNDDDDDEDDDENEFESTPSKSKKSSKSKNGKFAEARKCARCDKRFNDTKSLRAHIVVHFKDELDGVLPSRSPFNCPICKQKSTNKTTLIRHYLLTHNKIDKFASEEDLEGIDCHQEVADNRKSKFSFHKDDDDDDDDDDKDDESFPKIPARLGSGRATSKMDVSFSDTDSEDFKVDSSKTVMKTFDELFNDT